MQVERLKKFGFRLNPNYVLEIYSEEILLHIYFSTHFSVLKVANATYVGEKFRSL